MANIYDLKPFVIPYLNGVPNPVLEQGIRLACQQFITDTEIWTEINLMDSVADDDTYQITPDTAGTVVLRLIEVQLDDMVIDGCTLSYDNILTLPFEPASAGTNNLSIEIALKPAIATTTYPDWMYNRYMDVMRLGVLYHFKNMPGKQWSDPDGAKKYEREYRNEMHRVRVNKNTGRREGNLRTQKRRIW